MRCSRCHIDEHATTSGQLIEVMVITAAGEEGFAQITQLLCDLCFGACQAALMGLGFVDHRHGGINYLEDERCPGWMKPEDCPTPTEYGAVMIGQDPNADLAEQLAASSASEVSMRPQRDNYPYADEMGLPPRG